MILLPVVIRVRDEYLIVRPETSQARVGGKPASATILRPIKPNTKRANIFAWFCDSKNSRKVADACKHFQVSRQTIFAHWTVLNREHGIGYALDSDCLTPIIPGEYHGA